MSWDQLGAVLLSLGGGVAILAALSGWLGKLWAKRILEQEAHLRTREIELLKAELAKTLEASKAGFAATQSQGIELLKADLAKTLETSKAALAAAQARENVDLSHRAHVSKAQFDLEFKLYQDLWNRIEGLRGTSIKFWVSLKKNLSAGALSPRELEEAAKQQLGVETLYQSFVEYFLSQSPFIAASVKEWLDSHHELLAAINGVSNMAVEAVKNNRLKDFDQIAQAQREINALQTQFADVIRQRLASVSIVQ